MFSQVRENIQMASCVDTEYKLLIMELSRVRAATVAGLQKVPSASVIFL